MQLLRTLAVSAFLALGIAPDAMAQDPVPTETGGAELALQRKWQQAIESLTLLLAAEPDNVEALRWRAHAYTGAEQNAAALADLDRALELGTGDAWTHYARGMCLHHLGRLEDAVAAYSRTIGIEPGFQKAYEWRGFTRGLLANHVGAIADIDVALRIDDGNPWLRFIRGKAFAALLDFGRAEADFWKVLDGQPRHDDAQCQLGYLKACLGEEAAAIGFLEKGVALDAAQQFEARPWLHQLYARSGDVQAAAAQLDAIAAATDADGIDPAVFTWVRHLAAHLRGELGLEELLQRAVAEAPKPAEVAQRRCAALMHAGLAAQRRGDKATALLLLARAVATEASDQWEWSMARRQLRTLAGD